MYAHTYVLMQKLPRGTSRSLSRAARGFGWAQPESLINAVAPRRFFVPMHRGHVASVDMCVVVGMPFSKVVYVLDRQDLCAIRVVLNAC